MRLRRMWATSLTASVGAAGMLGLYATIGLPKDVAVAGKPAPVAGRSTTVAGHLHTEVLHPGSHGSVSLARRTTAPYSLVGITWADPRATFRGTIEVRTRRAGAGTWSPWTALETDGPTPAEDGAATRGGTDPLWVGPSDGIEVRVGSGGRTSTALPKGLRLDMVDPGRSAGLRAEPAAYVVADPTATPSPRDPPAVTATATATDAATPTGSPTPTETPAATGTDATAGTSTATASPTGTAPAAGTATDAGTDTATPSASASPSPTVPPAPPSTAPEPPIVSRAEWGADESISPEDPIYLPGGVVKAVAVHHTAGTNDYSCSDSAEIVRGIYTYHVQSEGWRDIGYNFLVDKCGTIFEGRKGGVDRPVYGAHTHGWNSETTGISMLGNYNEVAPSTAALTAVARIAAWKLGQYGGDPAGTVHLTAGVTQHNLAGTSFTEGTAYTFPQVFGHRDGVATECPGDNLWAALPTVRTWAAGPVQGLAVTSVSGAGRSGSTYYTNGTVTVHWKTTTPASLVSRFELLVDGDVAATAAGSATSASAKVPTGRHSLQVRAVHQSGKVTTSAALAVVGDITAPTFTGKPWVNLRTGTVDISAVPVTLHFRASDDAALRSVLQTSPSSRTFGPTWTAVNMTARSGTSTTWSLKALDYAGNTSTAATSATPVVLQESSATRYGSWSTRSSSGYLGGRSYSSASRGASLTWTFTGRSAAWVVSRAASSGQAYVYVDGAKAATVDLRSSTTKYRQAIWTRTWSTSAKHAVKVVVVGTSGRPTVTTDGLVYLR